MRHFLACLCVFSWVSSSAWAAIVSPREVVEKLYAPYLADPQAQEISEVSALDLIRPHASKALKHAIRRNDACERREHGVCAIDFDVIINGQDWDLSEFSLIEEESAETALPIVRAYFINSGMKNEVDYYFISEDGAWKIDDVEARHIRKKAKEEAAFKLKERLSQSLESHNALSDDHQ